MSIYDINVKTIDGSNMTLAVYREEVLLIVNVASQCGFTPQYAGLEALYRRSMEATPPLYPPQKGKAGTPRQRVDQVELHQVSRRSRRKSVESFCSDGYAGEDRGGSDALADIR